MRKVDYMMRELEWLLRSVWEKTRERVGVFSIDGGHCGSNADGNDDGKETICGSRSLLDLPPLALWCRFKWSDR